VVLSRDPRDFYELYEGIKENTGKVDSAVEHMNERFGTRDIAIKRTDDAASGEDPRGSVFGGDTSNKPSSSLVTQIQVRHR